MLTQEQINLYLNGFTNENGYLKVDQLFKPEGGTKDADWHLKYRCRLLITGDIRSKSFRTPGTNVLK